MQINSEEQRFIEVVMRMRSRSLSDYEELVQCMHALASASRDAMVGSPRDELLTMQGRAQALLSIARMFADAPSRFDAIKTSQQKVRS